MLGGQQDEDAGLEEDGSGSGDEMEAAPSFSVDIQEDSFLDLVFNIIPDTIDSITGGNTEVGNSKIVNSEAQGKDKLKTVFHYLLQISNVIFYILILSNHEITIDFII